MSSRNRCCSPHTQIQRYRYLFGERVYIGTGAKVLGPVTIGDDVKIGANAVAVKDVPNGATVVGPESCIIPQGDRGTVAHRVSN